MGSYSVSPRSAGCKMLRSAHGLEVLDLCAFVRRRQRRRVEYRVKLHQAQRPVSLTLFLISTFAFTLDTVTTLPYLLFRSALNYKTIPLYS